MGYLDDALGDAGDCCCSTSYSHAVARSGDTSQLGDIICTPSEAQAGEDTLKKLRNVYASAGSPVKWKPYVDDLEKRWKEYDDRWFKSVAWCDAKQIGVEAQLLLERIAADSNGQIAPPPARDPKLAPGPTDKFPDASTIGTGLLVAMAAAIIVPKLLQSRRGDQ